MQELPKSKYFRVIGTKVSSGARHVCIVICRKPSEFPGWLDLELLKIAGAGQSDPEKGLLLWEFLLPERLPDALNLLKRTGWTRIFLEENEIKMVYNVRTDDTVLRDFYDPKDAEDYLEYLMVGTHP